MRRSNYVIPDASALPLWRKSSHSGGESGACLEVSDVWRKPTYSVPDASALSIWRKSSYSGPSEGSCLEVSDVWRKSTYSGPSEGDCLEVNDAYTAHVPVRDSKNPHGPAVVFAPAAWTSFVGAVKTSDLG